MSCTDLFGEAFEATRPADPPLSSTPELIEAIKTIRPFVPPSQLAAMGDAMRGEERDFFIGKVLELSIRISTMPKTYEQDGQGDQAVAHLHYFIGGCDWHITEKDRDDKGTEQAFGLANLGYGPELGYISIDELMSIPGMQLDLYWTPVPLERVKATLQ